MNHSNASVPNMSVALDLMNSEGQAVQNTSSTSPLTLKNTPPNCEFQCWYVLLFRSTKSYQGLRREKVSLLQPPSFYIHFINWGHLFSCKTSLTAKREGHFKIECPSKLRPILSFKQLYQNSMSNLSWHHACNC